ncbi:putative monovalent cation/H+ antiporter subunit A [Niveispirillum cyanobacteriorum]|uniref:putative monovalent cation/H+ antiporter subunit A n=1 Tax=Niveispirillum cyanobacteriorum TaxID=1612173 RepID=UPI001319EF24|nr:putative monovalent cation/H+ antiporter subunit A [Niveispirillum cyanobacteriorum]GGE77448.1 Na(+)/H(+) antiporter subunit A [Niveispirillum cyanobacteriorum]
MILTAILAIILAAAIAPTLNRVLPALSHWLLALVPLSAALWFATQIPGVTAGTPVLETTSWAPSLGIALSFRLDGLSLLFALLICGIGAFIVIYSGGYLRGHPREGRFHLFILAFMAAMLGLVTADDLISLFVFWELTSITSFMLIGFNHEDARSRRSGIQALLVTGGGGMALLAGLVLMGMASGEWTLSAIATSGADLRTHALYPTMLVLLLLAAFTKSAQVPFHFWLPNAMDAPTPVSAYLHSATMVKAGVYLLARLNPTLGGTEPWFWALTIAGGVTALWGSAMALRSTDLKKILAYTTLMALGVLVLLIGIGSDGALKAFAGFLLAHSLYKGALFMGAGSVDHGSGTREVGELGGLWGKMPVTGLFIAVAALSMAGLPPLLGFVAKELIYDEVLRSGHYLALAALLLANAAMVAAAATMFFKPFLGSATKAAEHAHEGGPALLAGPGILACLSLLFGLWVGLPQGLLGAAADAVRGAPLDLELHLWHGFTPALGLSALTVAVGLGIYAGLPGVKNALTGIQQVTRIDHDRAWDCLLALLDRLARWITGWLQDGMLHRYLAWIFTGILVLLGATLAVRGGLVWPGISLEIEDALGGSLALLMLGGTVGAIRARSRMEAILSLAITGMSVALFFLLFGAPDVGITQLMVETLSAIILVLIMAKLPMLPPGSDRTGAAKLFHATLALGLGGVVSAIMLAVLDQPLALDLSRFFGDTSLLEAHGRNIVNVILVDFRGFDTLGEITVVASAGLGVFALLRARMGKRGRS